MSHSYNDRYYYTSYIIREDNYGAAGEGSGGLDTRTTNLPLTKVNLVKTRNIGKFRDLSVSTNHTLWNY